MIAVSRLCFRYQSGEFSLRIPELSVARGERVAVIGASGSGKTTFLHLVAGIGVPDEGQVETTGVEVTRLSDRERRDFRIANLGLVFQELELLEYLSVLDNILLPFRINTSLRLGRGVRERAVGLARQVGIADKLRRYPQQLSQGERQRVAVCRALLPQPALLLADEPTGNLDPANKGRVLDILFEYAERRQATLVVVTHEHDMLERFDRVIDFESFHVSEVTPPAAANHEHQ